MTNLSTETESHHLKMQPRTGQNGLNPPDRPTVGREQLFLGGHPLGPSFIDPAASVGSPKESERARCGPPSP